MKLDNLDKAKARCRANNVIIQQQIRHDGSRTFYTGSLETFCMIFQSPYHIRTNHETIHGGRPCKIVMDCDGDKLLSRDQELEFIKQVHDLVLKQFKFTFGTDVATPGPTAFVSSNSKYFSIHLTWEVWFSTPSAIEAFLAPICETKLFGINIDTNIYPSNDSHFSLRMPYCGKLQEDGRVYNYLIPHDTLDPAFNRKKFLLGLASMGVITGEIYHLPGHDGVKLCKTLDVRETEMSSIVINWFKLITPGFTFRKFQVFQEDGSFSFYTRGFCYVAGRYHTKGNGAYVRCYTKSGKIIWSCCNNECKGGLELDWNLCHLVPRPVKKLIIY